MTICGLDGNMFCKIVVPKHLQEVHSFVESKQEIWNYTENERSHCLLFFNDLVHESLNYFLENHVLLYQ